MKAIAKTKNILMLCITFLILGASLPSNVRASIMVHAHNPEGVEIASIEGMNPLSVKIYDGDTFIDYGANNAQTHNKPIYIPAGTHTIKVIFNKISKELTFNINENETKKLIFTFERTEFDLFSAIINNWTVNIEDSFEEEFSDGSNYYNYIQFPLFMGYYLTVCWSSMTGEGYVSMGAKIKFDSAGCWYLYTKWVGSTNGWANGDQNSNLSEDTASYAPANIPSYTNFDHWYIQCQQLKEPKYITYSTGYIVNNGVYARTEPNREILFSRDDYSMQTVSASSTIPYIHFGIPTFGSVYLDQGEHILSGKILSLRMSSIPYDLKNTGVKGCEKVIIEKILDKNYLCPPLIFWVPPLPPWFEEKDGNVDGKGL